MHMQVILNIIVIVQIQLIDVPYCLITIVLLKIDTNFRKC